MTKTRPKRHRVPVPAWIQDGVAVTLRKECPPTGMHGFVVGQPWLSTSGQWLVRLRDLRRPDRPAVPAGSAVVPVSELEERTP